MSGPSQFRVTAWPGPLPHPHQGPPLQYRLHQNVFVHPFALSHWADLRGEKSEFGDDTSGEPSRRFDEIYLQLLQLDLDDDVAVLSWVNEFGLLEIHEGANIWAPGIIHENPYRRLSGYPLFDGEP